MWSKKPLLFLFGWYIFQNFTLLKEMQLEGSACFLLCMTTSGTQAARWLTRITFGVRLKQNMKMIPGATAQLTVSASKMLEYHL